MNLEEFEKAVLKLAFETDARITTASAAYYLGIPSREANEFLNTLLKEGVLEFDSDSSGNLFYKVANHDGTSVPSLDDIQFESLNSSISEARFTTIEDSIASPAIKLRPRPRPLPVPTSERLPASTMSRELVALPSPSAPIKAQRVLRSPIQKILSSASDGTLGSLSAFVVAEHTRCDPKPIASQRSELATCEDVPSHLPTRIVNPWHPNDSNALVTYNDTRALMNIKEPNHQPGMALLLSLILPGTGQIYNNEVTKGVAMMVLTFLLWFVLLGWVVQIWSIVDAVVVAENLNQKRGQGGIPGDAQPQM